MYLATTKPRVSKGRNASRPEPLARRGLRDGDIQACAGRPLNDLSQRETLWV